MRDRYEIMIIVFKEIMVIRILASRVSGIS